MPKGKAHRSSNSDPDFLIGLGALYLAQNLLDPAEEALAKIPSEHNLYGAAAEMQIEIHSRKGNFQELVLLGEELVIRGNNSTWLAAKIGAAYYRLGQTSAAKSFCLESMRDIPDNSEVRGRLRSLRPLNHRPKIEALITGGPEFGISPHVALDCIAPIIWGGRPTSCCFGDQLLSNDSQADQRNFYLEFAAKLYQTFGIFTAFFPYVALNHNQCAPLIKLFFSLDPLVFDRVEDIKQSAWSDFEKQERGSKHRLEYLEKEGALLGYPQCCVKWAQSNRRSNKSIERLALTALIEEEYVCSLEGGEAVPPGLAYFAHEFYPCNPRCPAAEQAGIEIFEHYKKTEALLLDLYCQYVLPLNKAKMYYPESRYVDFVNNFNDSIIRVLKIEEFKKTHQDFDLYREEMSVILKEHPYFENLEALPLVYAMAKQ